jgi:hypothetical protein
LEFWGDVTVGQRMIQLLERHPEVSALQHPTTRPENHVQATRWMLDMDIPDAVAK